MMVITLLVLFCVKADLVAGGGGHYGSGHDSDWNYVEGTLGPSNWSANYPICGADNQSPINILSKQATINEALGTLELQNYATTTNVSFVMRNRYTDIEFAAKAVSGVVPQAVVYKGTTYRLFQFHYHWGSTNFQGSEHLLDWQQFAAEMHIIHYNDKYANVSEALDKKDGLLVWGHFLKVDSKDKVANPAFQMLLNKFPHAVISDVKTEVTLDLKALLPSKYDHFYTYNGSLTTPPCYESVNWIVNPNPILVSEAQMEVFRTLKDGMMNNITIVDHYRPVQPLNTRNVEMNFDPADECSAAVTIKPASTIFFVVAVLIFTMCSS